MKANGNGASRILIFGAGGHIGGPLARLAQQLSPQTGLRLATSSAAKAAGLRREFPRCEVAFADYLDHASLRAALVGVDRIFVITPDFFDEVRAMSNLVEAAKAAGSVRHMVRILADTPGMTLDKLPQELKCLGPGPALQHFEARAILTDSDLPVTFLNSAGYFMDDFLIHFGPPLKAKRKLVVPYDRLMCFTDTTDLAEVAARLLLSNDQRHAGCYYHFNSGEPPILFSEAAALMSEITGEAIEYDGTAEGFLSELGPTLKDITGDDRAAHYFLVNWRMERDQQKAFFGSPFGATILGRDPTTLKQWIQLNKDSLLA